MINVLFFIIGVLLGVILQLKYQEHIEKKRADEFAEKMMEEILKTRNDVNKLE